MIDEINIVFEKQRDRRRHCSTSAADRIGTLRRLRESVVAHAHQVSLAVFEDLSKPLPEAEGDTVGSLAEIDCLIAGLEEWMKPIEVEPSAPAAPGARARIVYEPKGLVLIISPWNFPFSLAIRPLAGAIAAGNSCILKPSELAPRTSTVLAKIIREVFHVSEAAVFEGEINVALQLLDLPFDHVFFTGSTAIGKKVMVAAANDLASVTLELGGKSPVIVDRNLDLTKVAEKIAWGKLINSGQACVAPDHLWIHKDDREALLTAMIAYIRDRHYRDGQFDTSTMSRIVNDRNIKRLVELIDDAVHRGAEIVHGGNTVDEWMEPTLLVNVQPDSAIMREEIFGPILPIMAYDDPSEVVEALAAGDKPLALYLFSRDQAFIDRFLTRLSSGGVTINDVFRHPMDLKLPFGGVGSSGIGAYHGKFSFQELSHRRSIYHSPAMVVGAL